MEKCLEIQILMHHWLVNQCQEMILYSHCVWLHHLKFHIQVVKNLNILSLVSKKFGNKVRVEMSYYYKKSMAHAWFRTHPVLSELAPTHCLSVWW